MIPRSLIAALSPFPEPGPEPLFRPSPQARVSLAVCHRALERSQLLRMDFSLPLFHAAFLTDNAREVRALHSFSFPPLPRPSLLPPSRSLVASVTPAHTRTDTHTHTHTLSLSLSLSLSSMVSP